MFTSFKRKPLMIIWAAPLNLNVYRRLSNMGWVNKKENPINIYFDFAPDVIFQWNQHTKKLSLYTEEGEVACKPGDWLVKESVEEHCKYYIVSNDMFTKLYEPFDDSVTTK